MDTSGGAPNDQSSGSDQTKNQEKSDLVSYETYKKTLDEAKRAKASLKALQEEKDSLLQEKLLAEGKKDEALGNYKNQLSELSKKLESKEKDFVWSLLSQNFKSIAEKHGCVDSDVLMTVSIDDLKTTNAVSDDFKVDDQKINSLIEQVKIKKPYLFKNKTAKVNDININSRQNKSDLSSLSVAELQGLLAKHK